MPTSYSRAIANETAAKSDILLVSAYVNLTEHAQGAGSPARPWVALGVSAARIRFAVQRQKLRNDEHLCRYQHPKRFHGSVIFETSTCRSFATSLQACIASLPLLSSLMSKTYLKSDHFSGGGSLLYAGFAIAASLDPG